MFVILYSSELVNHRITSVLQGIACICFDVMLFCNALFDRQTPLLAPYRAHGAYVLVPQPPITMHKTHKRKYPRITGLTAGSAVGICDCSCILLLYPAINAGKYR